MAYERQSIVLNPNPECLGLAYRQHLFIKQVTYSVQKAKLVKGRAAASRTTLRHVTNTRRRSINSDYAWTPCLACLAATSYARQVPVGGPCHVIPYHSPQVWRFYPFRTGHLLMCCDAASTVREILHFTATKTISNTSHHLLDTRLCLLVVTLLSLKYLEKPEHRL